MAVAGQGAGNRLAARLELSLKLEQLAAKTELHVLADYCHGIERDILRARHGNLECTLHAAVRSHREPENEVHRGCDTRIPFAGNAGRSLRRRRCAKPYRRSKNAGQPFHGRFTVSRVTHARNRGGRQAVCFVVFRKQRLIAFASLESNRRRL